MGLDRDDTVTSPLRMVLVRGCRGLPHVLAAARVGRRRRRFVDVIAIVPWTRKVRSHRKLAMSHEIGMRYSTLLVLVLCSFQSISVFVSEHPCLGFMMKLRANGRCGRYACEWPLWTHRL